MDIITRPGDFSGDPRIQFLISAVALLLIVALAVVVNAGNRRIRLRDMAASERPEADLPRR